jgi:hypothetical protein
LLLIFNFLGHLAVTKKPSQQSDLEHARQLWAGRFQGVLSTQSVAEPGYPFGSVVPYCLDRTGLPVFLLSHLAQHCKNLETDPRCAFTIAEPAGGDVQQSLRLTCLGDCSLAPPDDSETNRRYLRYFRYFPNARTYFEQLNFRLYRLVLRRFHYNGGFATARWLGTDRVVRPSTLNPAQEMQLVDHIERTHPRLLGELDGGSASAKEQARIPGIDPWGLDLALGERLTRIPFPRRLDSQADLDAHLHDLL